MIIIYRAHPFVSTYGLFLDMWNSTGIHMSELFGIYPVQPAHFLRSIQLLTSVYWKYITTLSPAQALILLGPDFTQLINAFRIQYWTIPQLPGSPMGAHTTSTAPWPAPSYPPAPGTSLGPSPGLGINPPRRRMENLSPVADIKTAMEGRTFHLSSLLAYGVRPPRNYKEELCLSYHCRFSWLADCARRGSQHPLNYKEKTDMCHWVNNNVVTPNVGREDRTSSWSDGPSSITTDTDCRPHLAPINSTPPTTSSVNMDNLGMLGEVIVLYTNIYIEHESWNRLFH